MKPPFEITENILNLLTAITEKITRVEISMNRKKELYLRKSSRIKSVNSSCAIEANSLTEDEVFDIINGKAVLAPLKEIKEVENAYEAYLNIEAYNPYKVESFLDAHKTLTRNLIDESGRFRNGGVAVFADDKIVHLGAKAEFVPKLIEELFNWAKESDLNPLIKSSVIHFEIEFIHPFSDGNGRIGRLWQSLILCKYNRIFAYLPVETLIYENQEAYYLALNKSEKEGNSTIFIEFMLDMILQTLEKFGASDSLVEIRKEYIKDLTKTEKEILSILVSYFSDNELLDNETAVILLNKSKVNIRKYFGRFIKLNILIPIGENKGRKYKLNNKIKSI